MKSKSSPMMANRQDRLGDLCYEMKGKPRKITQRWALAAQTSDEKGNLTPYGRHEHANATMAVQSRVAVLREAGARNIRWVRNDSAELFIDVEIRVGGAAAADVPERNEPSAARLSGIPGSGSPDNVALSIDLVGSTHLSEEQIERYGRRATASEDLPRLEEHLIACRLCQSRAYQFEEYRALMRDALTQKPVQKVPST